jgi:hypothetical protein
MEVHERLNLGDVFWQPNTRRSCVLQLHRRSWRAACNEPVKNVVFQIELFRHLARAQSSQGHPARLADVSSPLNIVARPPEATAYALRRKKSLFDPPVERPRMQLKFGGDFGCRVRFHPSTSR